MAHPRALVLLLSVTLLLLIIVVHCESHDASGVDLGASLRRRGRWKNPYAVQRSACPRACSKRCSATSKRKPCMFFCTKCCSKCLCVPPGTYGNKQVCPCYNNWKTQSGGPKCP